MNKVALIIKREYSSRVKKKSFIIMTILGPLLIAAFYAAAIYIGIQQSDQVEVLLWTKLPWPEHLNFRTQTISGLNPIPVPWTN